MTVKIRDSFIKISYKFYLYLIFIVLANISCYQDPISIDISEFDQNIVIEGYITDQAGINTVRISKTIQISTENAFPAVTGAIVTIFDNLNASFQLTETEPGIYQNSTLAGVADRTYTLTVSYQGKTYHASSRMPQPLYFHSLYFQQIAPGVEHYELSCYMKDRSGIKDYCLVNLYINDYLAEHFLYQDDKSDGDEIIFDDFDNIFNYGDQVVIDLLSIDKPTYDFFYTLDKISESDEGDFEDTFIPVTTYNPTTNLNNGALGYFSAQAVRRYTRIVE